MIRTRTQEHTHSKGDHLGDVEGEGATNASSEVNAAMSGGSMHLASDLPDPLTSSSEERVAGEAPIVEESMGANGSHEVNANLHSSVAQLQGVKAQASAREQKDGKLRKPSKSVRLSSRATTATTLSRRQAPNRKPRSSAYDIGEELPEEFPLPVPKLVTTTAFSPMRKQKGKGKRPDAQESSNLRRSNSVQVEHDDQDPVEIAARELQKKGSRRVEEQADVEGGAEDARFRDRFPDPVVRRYAEQQAAAGTDEVLHNEAEQSSNTPANDAEATEQRPQASSKRKAASLVATESQQQRKSRRLEQQQDSSRSYEVKQDARGDELSESIVPDQNERGKMSLRPSSVPTGVKAKSKALVSERQASNRATRSSNKSATPAEDRVASETRQPRGSAGDDGLPNRQSRGKLPVVERLQAPKNARLVELRRRRSGEPNGGSGIETDTNANQGDDAESTGLEREEENLEEEGAGEEEQDRSNERPIQIRPSEMGFGDSVVEPSSEDGQPEASTSRKTKKNVSSKVAKANTGAKRKKTAHDEDFAEPSDDEEADDHVEYEEDESDAQYEEEQRTRGHQSESRLWGQWPALDDIYQNLGNVGRSIVDGEPRQRKIKLRDPDVRTIVDLCNEAKKRYREFDGEDDADSDVDSVLRDITRRVRGLQGHHNDFPTDFKSKRKTANIYFHLMPALVRLLRCAITSYEALDLKNVAGGQITDAHLETVVKLIQLTLDMEFAAKTKYARPNTSLAIVKPVNSGIAIPLREVHKNLRKTLHLHEQHRLGQERRESEAQDRALQLEQEERENRQKAADKKRRQAWQELHLVRRLVEPVRMVTTTEKKQHLRMPDPYTDYDQNGDAFNRVQIFRPRIGPPPGLVDQASRIVWRTEELVALHEGLETYAGDRVFEDLMIQFCPRGKVLNRFNVTEIVTAAADLKEFLSERQMQELGEVEAWVRLIPVWTKGHADGQENDDGFVDVHEVDGGQDEAVL